MEEVLAPGGLCVVDRARWEGGAVLCNDEDEALWLVRLVVKSGHMCLDACFLSSCKTGLTFRIAPPLTYNAHGSSHLASVSLGHSVYARGRARPSVVAETFTRPHILGAEARETCAGITRMVA